MKKLIFLSIIVVLTFSCSSDEGGGPIENAQIIEPSGNGDEPLNLPISGPCKDGMVGDFSCFNYDLIFRMDLEALSANSGNDSWGWTDPSTGKEYALMGLDNGTAFIDLSNPATPIYLGKLGSQSGSSPWRDIKVYNNYAFIVSEATNHGMQIFDLTQLQNVSNPPVSFSASAVYNEFGSAHNIVINEDTGYAYAVGTSTFNGGPHFINIQDPLNPIAAGGYGMDSYSHDAQVITYNGPDTEHQGKEILIGSNENEIVIVDITDKNNPENLSSITYDQIGYTHQGWFTDDHRYFIVGDELDELNFGFNSRTLIFNVSDLDNPVFHADYIGPTAAIDHNGYVKDNLLYLANYTAGLRVISLGGIDTGQLEEVGYFDSYVEDNTTSFHGAWSVYPFFASGNIIISDINSGLYIVKRN